MLTGAEDVVQVLGLLLVELAEHLLAEHLREADDGVQRRAQLVRHVGQELRLVAARGLELPVEPPELVVHRVDVRGQRPELVAVRNLDRSGEVARGNAREARLHPPDGPDQRPRQDVAEQQGQDDARRGHCDEESLRIVERAPILRGERVRFREGRAHQAGREAVDVFHQRLRALARELKALARLGGLIERGDLRHHVREQGMVLADLLERRALVG